MEQLNINIIDGFKNKNNIINIYQTNNIVFNNINKLYSIIGNYLFNIDDNKLLRIVSSNRRFDYVIRIIENTSKVNIIDNKLLTEEFIDYVCPNLNIKYILYLLKYDTTATKNITDLIKNNRIGLINSIITFFEDKVGKLDERMFHTIFINFNTCEKLFNELISKNISKEDYDRIQNNLIETIQNGNIYNISTIYELEPNNYKLIENQYLKSIMSNKDIKELKKDFFRFVTAKVDDFYSDNPIIKMIYYLKFYRLDEICDEIRSIAIDNIKREAKRRNIVDEVNNKLTKCEFTNEERMFLTIIQFFVKCEDEEVIKILIEEMKNVSNISMKFKNIVDKTRNLFNLEMNMKLSSNLDDLDGTRYTSANGVQIIEPSGNFNFLCHTLYGYDKKHSSYVNELINNPSMWYKLDGSSTISTSSVSNRNISILGKEVREKKYVTYLFNQTPDNFLLVMNTQDLDLEHGNNVFQPTFSYSSFTTLDGLNFQTSKSGYNEIAGWREGMVPCAIACLDEEPSQEQIKSAQYFNIPIIKMNKCVNKDLVASFDEFEEYKETLSYDSLVNYIFNNLGEYEYDLNTRYISRIEKIMNYLLASFRYSVKSKNIEDMDFFERIMYKKNTEDYHIISREELVSKLNELEKVICQIYSDDFKELYMKIISIRYSISESFGLSDEEISNMENSKDENSDVIIKKSGIKYGVSTTINNYGIETNVTQKR